MIQTMTATDADGKIIQGGDSVYTYDFDGKTKVYGVLHWDVKFWYVAYDDGDECIVLDFKQLWKA